MSRINKPTAPLVPPTTDEDVEVIVAEAIAADDTHAPLVNDLVPAENLPSYVDDVLEFADAEHFPAEGEVGKIYVARDTNLTYRWSGAAYIQVGGASLGAGDGIEIENDIVSVDEEYLNGHLEFEAPIEDLATIRSGAAAGATAVQPTAMETALNSKANNFIYHVNFDSETAVGQEFSGTMSDEDYEQLMLDPEHALIAVYIESQNLHYVLPMAGRQRLTPEIWVPIYNLPTPQGAIVAWIVHPDKNWGGMILDSYALKSDLASKQDILVSGTNIKTVNNQSLLGSGNVEIQGGVSQEQVVGLLNDAFIHGDYEQDELHVLPAESIQGNFYAISLGTYTDIILNQVEYIYRDVYNRVYHLFPDFDDSAVVHATILDPQFGCIANPGEVATEARGAVLYATITLDSDPETGDVLSVLNVELSSDEINNVYNRLTNLYSTLEIDAETGDYAEIFGSLKDFLDDIEENGWQAKANASDTYTKSEVDTAIATAIGNALAASY